MSDQLLLVVCGVSLGLLWSELCKCIGRDYAKYQANQRYRHYQAQLDKFLVDTMETITAESFDVDLPRSNIIKLPIRLRKETIQ